MANTIKKLCGVVALLLLVVIYALVATTIAAAQLAESDWWVHVLYFFFTGLLWVIPAMFLIRWMIGLPSANDSSAGK